MGCGGGGGSGGGGGGSGGSYAGGGGGGGSSSASPPTAGAFRFNTDSSQLEIYDGNQWTGVLATSPEQQTGGTRAMSVAGEGPGGATSNIQLINMASTGNSVQSNGAYYAGKTYLGGTSSRTRAVFFGGYSTVNDMYYNEIASDGSSIDFGNLTSARWGVAGASNGVRGLAMGGTLGPGTVTAGESFIEYVTISSTGDSKDFGDLTYEPGAGYAVNSPTRAICYGGYDDVANDSATNMDYVTTSTLGNAADFGNLSEGVYLTNGCSNAVRGIRFGGYASGAGVRRNNIEYVQLATLGDMIDFGDLTQITSNAGSASSPTRGINMGGTEGPNILQTIDYITIMSTGNAIDFGDMSAYPIKSNVGVSNGHGGL